MNAIRNYLDNMFRNLPNTEEVRRAKTELLEMMEDKYEELIKEGKTENEAVGIVISEFGNLDELAESLGISEAVAEQCSFLSRSDFAFSLLHLTSLQMQFRDSLSFSV